MTLFEERTLMPALLRPLMAVFAPPYDRRDLDRYFRELDSALV
jgi:hypothetical protein